MNVWNWNAELVAALLLRVARSPKPYKLGIGNTYWLREILPDEYSEPDRPQVDKVWLRPQLFALCTNCKRICKLSQTSYSPFIPHCHNCQPANGMSVHALEVLNGTCHYTSYTCFETYNLHVRDAFLRQLRNQYNRE